MGRDGRLDYDLLYRSSLSELRRGESRGVSLQLICALLQREVPHYDWFGFYLAVPDEEILVLGPFEGEPTEHIRIPFGRGICGQAASRRKTFVTADVALESDYLACSPSVKSEIVVPIVSESGVVLGEIDVDSHETDAFSTEDVHFLERLAPETVPYLPVIPPYLPARKT